MAEQPGATMELSLSDVAKVSRVVMNNGTPPNPPAHTKDQLRETSTQQELPIPEPTVDTNSPLVIPPQGAQGVMLLEKPAGTKTIKDPPSSPFPVPGPLPTGALTVQASPLTPPKGQATRPMTPAAPGPQATIPSIQSTPSKGQLPSYSLANPSAPPPPSQEDDPFLGYQVGNYKIEKKIGKGGFGSVYKASHVYIPQSFAVKVLHVDRQTDPEVVERFKREAHTLSQIRHKHVVQLADFGMLPERGFYLAMEYLEGRNLQGILKRGYRFSISQIKHIISQLCEVLHYVHQKGIVHRDLKPANIFILRESNEHEPQIRLLDFGIAALTETNEELTSAGSYLGTAKYISPEQAQGAPEIDGRADLYSLGIILYRLLTGELPFMAPHPMTILYNQINMPAPTLKSLSPDEQWHPRLEAFLQRVLAKTPNARPQNGEQFWKECQEALNAQEALNPQSAPPPSTPSQDGDSSPSESLSHSLPSDAAPNKAKLLPSGVMLPPQPAAPVLQPPQQPMGPVQTGIPFPGQRPLQPIHTLQQPIAPTSPFPNAPQPGIGSPIQPHPLSPSAHPIEATNVTPSPLAQSGLSRAQRQTGLPSVESSSSDHLPDPLNDAYLESQIDSFPFDDDEPQLPPNHALRVVLILALIAGLGILLWSMFGPVSTTDTGNQPLTKKTRQHPVPTTKKQGTTTPRPQPIQAPKQPTVPRPETRRILPIPTVNRVTTTRRTPPRPIRRTTRRRIIRRRRSSPKPRIRRRVIRKRPIRRRIIPRRPPPRQTTSDDPYGVDPFGKKK